MNPLLALLHQVYGTSLQLLLRAIEVQDVAILGQRFMGTNSDGTRQTLQAGRQVLGKRGGLDRLTDDANAGAEANANHFRISDAIDANGKHKDLEYIDFVKVQVAVNTKSGWLGEVSTEVLGFYDYNMKKEL